MMRGAPDQETWLPVNQLWDLKQKRLNYTSFPCWKWELHLSHLTHRIVGKIKWNHVDEDALGVIELIDKCKGITFLSRSLERANCFRKSTDRVTKYTNATSITIKSTVNDPTENHIYSNASLGNTYQVAHKYFIITSKWLGNLVFSKSMLYDVYVRTQGKL